jgi:ribosome-associated translation inhibitor RaiA
MQITVSGKQVDLSDALRTRVADGLDTIAGKYFDGALEANVTFSRARSCFTVTPRTESAHRQPANTCSARRTRPRKPPRTAMPRRSRP